MKIKKGDIVDIIAPSSAPNNKDWVKGVKILKSWGLKPRYRGDIISPWHFHSKTNSKRLKELNQSFKNSQSQIVWPLRGGYGMQKLMSDFVKSVKSESLKNKTFIGFSDATAMHLYLNNDHKISTWHAPFVSELCHLSPSELKHLKQVLFQEVKEIKFSNLKMLGSPKSKTLKAPIMGGNLTLLSSSIACSWFSKAFKPCFLFLEDVNEDLYKIDRYLHHLWMSGYLKNVKALLLGHFHPVKLKDLQTQVLKPFYETSGIPIFTGMPCGHGKKNKALPFLKDSQIKIINSQKSELIIRL